MDQLVLFGCAQCGSPERGTVSNRLCDGCLLIVLEGCSTGAEFWLEHPDYAGYQMSSFGQVRTPKGRLLKGSLDEGYLRVDMRDRRRKMHQLVLETFIGPCPTGLEACHWNDDGADNMLMNLRWDTHEANLRDYWRRNGRPVCREAGCPLTARTNSPGARCEMHYRAFRHEVAQRAMALSVRIG